MLTMSFKTIQHSKTANYTIITTSTNLEQEQQQQLTYSWDRDYNGARGPKLKEFLLLDISIQRCLNNETFCMRF